MIIDTTEFRILIIVSVTLIPSPFEATELPEDKTVAPVI